MLLDCTPVSNFLSFTIMKGGWRRTVAERLKKSSMPTITQARSRLEPCTGQFTGLFILGTTDATYGRKFHFIGPNIDR